MTSEQIVGYVLGTLGGSAVVLLIVGFLCRSLILHLLAKDVDKYKEQLRATTEVQMAECRHRLEILRVEHEVCFSRLHAERFDCLKDLSIKAGELCDVLTKVLSPLPPANPSASSSRDEFGDRTNDARQAIRAFDNHFRRVEIFLPKEFAKNWNDALREAGIAVIKVHHAVSIQTSDWKSDAKREEEAVTRLIDVVLQIRSDLLEQGRKILEKV